VQVRRGVGLAGTLFSCPLANPLLIWRR
jgi:hypothetical protein